MDVKTYGLVTAAYWGFTLTDGALRMLVLFYFHGLGFAPVSLAFLFLLYEFCGVITNLAGGWIGSRFGLRITLFSGLAIQIVALLLLSFVDASWENWTVVSFVMFAQALSGIAKDLTKMSSKSAVKLVVNTDKNHSALFKWVAILTGSKNALKGVGFLLGGVMLSQLGFVSSLRMMAVALFAILLASLVSLKDLGQSKKKVPFRSLFSKSREINLLSVARFFLFGSRDVWFVVGLPVFLKEALGWSFGEIGGYLAIWVIGYGIVQATVPKFFRDSGDPQRVGRGAQVWCFLLFVLTFGLSVVLELKINPAASAITGLILFGIVFAINSSVHSFLILAYTDADKVALNVGFYYMANASGRLVGTLLSGVMYLLAGFTGCIWTSTIMLGLAFGTTLGLPTAKKQTIGSPAS